MESHVPLELEVDRKLELPGRPCVDRLAEGWDWCQKWAVDGIQFSHVRSVEQVEGLDHEIELPVRLDAEVLEDAKIERR